MEAPGGLAGRRLLSQADGHALKEVPRGRGRLATKINHVIMKRWLENYYKRQAALRPSSPGTGPSSAGGTSGSSMAMAAGEHREHEQTRDRGGYVTAKEMKNLAGPAAQPQPCRIYEGPELQASRSLRTNLVILPAGDRFNPDK
jgi:hypothetical protein